jgi:hypothetical protein
MDDERTRQETTEDSTKEQYKGYYLRLLKYLKSCPRFAESVLSNGQKLYISSPLPDDAIIHAFDHLKGYIKKIKIPVY